MFSKEEAYKQVADLTERFDEQFASYKKTDYNEMPTRRDFIDPFFKALGWDALYLPFNWMKSGIVSALLK